jgi:hypothetical protein
MFRRPRRARPAPLLNERGQGFAVLLSTLALLFWVVHRASGG